MIVDLFLVYQFIKRLATPFKEWEAYKLGIIDENGNQLKKRKDFTTIAEREAFAIFDILVMKLKRLLEKVPGGKTRIGSYAAALYLIKEHKNIENVEDLSEEHITETFNKYKSLIEKNDVVKKDLDTLFEQIMTDEVAIANSSANIPANEPAIKSSQMKKYKDKNKKYASFKRHVTKVE